VACRKDLLKGHYFVLQSIRENNQANYCHHRVAPRLPCGAVYGSLSCAKFNRWRKTGRLVECQPSRGFWPLCLPHRDALAAFVVGCAIVLRSWRSDAEFQRATLEIFATVRAHVASVLIAGATLMVLEGILSSLPCT